MASAKAPNPKPVIDPCAQCHDDLGSVLPKGHASIEKTNFAGCLKCHMLAKEGDAEENKFSTRIHLAHGGAAVNLDCITCHSYVPGKSFGIIGQSISWGAPKDDDLAAMKESLASWAQSSHTDHLHATAMIDCGGCHGKETPVVDATVANSRCLSCHGPLEKLAAKTTPKELPQRNPHKSHLGDVACTVCHHAHTESTVYCLTCHSNFGMKIPGAGQ
jgi:hypothetical protein